MRGPPPLLLFADPPVGAPVASPPSRILRWSKASRLRGVFPVSVTVGLYREKGLGKSGSVGRFGRMWIDEGVTCGVVADAVGGAKFSQELTDGGHAQAAAFAQSVNGLWSVGQSLKEALFWRKGGRGLDGGGVE